MNEMLAYIGVVLMASLTGVGSVIGVTICGNATVAGLKKNPDALGQYIGLAALPSSQGLYGFVASFLSLGAIQNLGADMTAFQAWAFFAVNVALGVVGFFSSYRQAQVCAAGVQSISNGNNVFAGTMIMAVFPELYAILTLVVVLMTVLPHF